jgi:hypothetical protein
MLQVPIERRQQQLKLFEKARWNDEHKGPPRDDAPSSTFVLCCRLKNL